MYKTILVTLDGNPTDRAIIAHIQSLAKLLQSRVVLLHVATGVAAKFHREDAAGEEVKTAQAYLDKVCREFTDAGIACTPELAFGEPVKEIVRWVEEKGCDLVAMSTHGHQLLADIVYGATASKVQHSISVPVLLLRAR